MNKKTYITPASNVVLLETNEATMLSQSEGVANANYSFDAREAEDTGDLDW